MKLFWISNVYGFKVFKQRLCCFTSIQQGQQEASNNFVLVQWNRPNGPQTETIASTELIFDGDRGVTMQRNGEIWQGQILSVSHGMDGMPFYWIKWNAKLSAEL